jgi:hypothetical protein
MFPYYLKVTQSFTMSSTFESQVKGAKNSLTHSKIIKEITKVAKIKFLSDPFHPVRNPITPDFSYFELRHLKLERQLPRDSFATDDLNTISFVLSLNQVPPSCVRVDLIAYGRRSPAHRKSLPMRLWDLLRKASNLVLGIIEGDGRTFPFPEPAMHK